MSKAAAAIVILILASAAESQTTTQPLQAARIQQNAPWAVSVIHTINLQKMVEAMRQQEKLRVGVAGTAPPYVYHVTTGIMVDDLGHVVTRLTNLDQDTQPDLKVTTADGTTLQAKLIGVDFATGFAVLDVALLKATAPKIAAQSTLLNGAPVKILSSDVVQRSVIGKVYLAPSITASQGQVLIDAANSRARVTLTLRSNSFLARGDGSVVVTPDDLVIGIAEYAGFGRAYVYPIEFIRDTVVKRVVEKNDNVPAGWLGVTGESVGDLSEADLLALGLQRRSGVIVRDVAPESAAAHAGIVHGDVIMRVDGVDIAGATDLRALLSSLPAGQQVKLSAIRDHQPVELKAVLGARPNPQARSLWAPFPQGTLPELSERDQLEKRLEELKASFFAYQKRPPSREASEAIRELEIEIRRIYDDLRAMGPENTGPPAPPSQSSPRAEYPVGNLTFSGDVSFRVGFAARALTPQLAANLQARGGVFVSSVTIGSPAERAGLKAGDVIIGTQERVILSLAQLQAFLSAQHGAVPLKVVRTRETIVVSLNIQ